MEQGFIQIGLKVRCIKICGLDFKPISCRNKYLEIEFIHSYLVLTRNNPWARGEYEHAMREIKANIT